MAAPLLPVWGTDGTNNAPPIATQQKSGWTTGQDGVSSYDNWWKNLVYQWLGHLSHRDVLDQLIPALQGFTQDPQIIDVPVTDLIYALTPNPGAAFPTQASSVTKLKITPGVLMQLRGGELYAYKFDGTVEYALSNGDATNPRVDILQMKIDIVAGDTAPTVTVNIKQGTPAASPTYPAPDVDYCVVAGVVIPAAWTGTANGIVVTDATVDAVLHDQRMPLCVKAIETLPKEYEFNDLHITGSSAPGWQTVGTGALGGTTIQASGTAAPVAVPVRSNSSIQRVLGHRIGIYDVGTYAAAYKQRTYKSNGVGGGISIVDTALNGGVTAFVNQTVFTVSAVNMVNIQAVHTPAVGPTVHANANGMGPPLWTTGYRAPGFDSGRFDTLMLSLTGDGGSQLAPVTFYLAGGL